MATVARGGIRDSHRMKKPYRACYPIEGGKELSKCFATRGEAQRWLDERVAEAIERERERDASPEMTLAQFWRAERRMILLGLKRGTVNHYENAVTRYILPKHVLDDGRSWPALGDRALKDIRARHCMELVDAMEALGLQEPTRRSYMAVLSKMFRIADREHLLPRGNPMRSIQMPKGKKPDIIPLTADQVIAIQDHMPEHLQLAVSLMAVCGLRISECLGLAPSALTLGVDDEGREVYTLNIVRGLVRSRGKSYLDTPKTKNSKRQVPVPSSLTEPIKRHLEDFPHPEFVFHTPGGSWVEYSNFRQRAWEPACKKAGLKVGIHVLRHTAVCTWINQGLTDPQIMAMAGHGSAYYLKETYGHYQEAVARSGIERVGDAALRRRVNELSSSLPSPGCAR